jgi:hypothetical protein
MCIDFLIVPVTTFVLYIRYSDITFVANGMIWHFNHLARAIK